MAPTITYSNKGGNEPFPSIATFKITGDFDAAATVLCGFHPSRIDIQFIDVTNGSANFMGIWYPSMTAGHYILIGADGAVSEAATEGPSLYSGADGLGFTVPAFAAADVDGDIYYVTAYR